MSERRRFLEETHHFSLSLFLASVGRDLRVSLRSLVRTSGFTLMVVLSLGLGIGASTVIFGLVDGIVLRPVAVPHAGELVTIDTAASRVTKFGDSSYLDYVDYSKQNRSFLGMIAYRRVTIGMNPEPEHADARPSVVWGVMVSGNYFSLFGVTPALGRGFFSQEDQALGKAPVAIISYSLWERSFNSDPNAVRKSIKLNNHLYTIIGVAPRSFIGFDLSYRPDIYVPMAMIGDIVPGGNGLLQSRRSRSFVIRGRIRAGITISEAQAEASIICADLTRQFPATNRDTNYIVRSDLNYRMEGNGVVLPVVLMGLVFFVLLIACANVASLLMARATGQMGTIATQLALGASRSRLLRQLMTESTILSILGGACGIILAILGMTLATRLVPYQPVPQGPLFRMDGRVLLYALTASALTIFLCGLAPSFMATREAAQAALRVRSSTTKAFGIYARRALIVCQVALSLILLIASALFVEAFTRLHKYDLGFNPNHVYLVTMNPSLYSYSPAQTAQFYKELLARVSSMPGVKSASLAAIPPFLGLYSQDISIDGYTNPGGDKVVDTLTNRISPAYFETLQIPFVLGRNFTENDKADTPKVAIVNETFARRFITGEGDLNGVIGHVFRRRDDVPIQIVGIVKDSVYGVATPLGSPAAPEFYIPFLQYTDSYAAIQARTEGDPDGLNASLIQQIHQLDPDIAPMYNLSLSAVVTERALYLPRVSAVLSGILAMIALTLALIGLYGVISYTVQTRTQEIGIRMALGAQRSSVLRMILGSTISLVGLGLAGGILGALALSGYLANLLVGVSPRDPIIYIFLSTVMLVAAIIASLIPAARATRIQPVIALRYE
jgi:predicted permease